MASKPSIHRDQRLHRKDPLLQYRWKRTQRLKQDLMQGTKDKVIVITGASRIWFIKAFRSFHHPIDVYSGIAAPFTIHSRIFAANSSWVSSGFDLPSAGLHPDCLTKLSSETCLRIFSSVLPPFCFGSFNWRASSAVGLPV